MQSNNRLKLSARKARLLLAPAACLLPLLASDATAVEIDKTVSFECPFPLAGPQTVDLRIQGDLPRPDNSGALTTGPTPLNLTAELDTSFLAALGLTAGPSVIEPDGSLYFSLESNAGKLPFEVTADFEKSEPFFGSALITIPGTATLPALNISGGQVELFVDDFRLDARTYLNDGSLAPQPLGAFQSDCTPVNGSVLLYSSDSINEPNPVSLAAGGIVSLAKFGFISEISSSIEIPALTSEGGEGFLELGLDSLANTWLFGLIPLKLELAFVSPGTSDETLDLDVALESGEATLTTQADIAVVRAQARFFGKTFDLTVPETCRTLEAVTIELAGQASPDLIGSFAGEFSIGGLGDCGLIRSNFLTGEGNTMLLETSAQ